MVTCRIVLGAGVLRYAGWRYCVAHNVWIPSDMLDCNTAMLSSGPRKAIYSTGRGRPDFRADDDADEIRDLYALLAECRDALRDYGYDDTELYARLVRTEAM